MKTKCSPLISVILPIYNMEAYLEYCLDSIKNQTYKNIEVIMVDDGSTDSSAEICLHYSENDARFIYVFKENGGQSSARNLGLEKSAGDYLTFVDSDDLIAAEAYEIVVKDINECNPDIVQFGFYMGTDIKSPQFQMNHNVCTNKSMILKDYLFNGPDVIWNKVYRKEIFEKLRFCEGIIKEDTYILPTIFKSTNSLLTINNCLYFYRQRNGSLMNSAFSKRQYDTAVVCDHMVEEMAFDEDLKAIALARSAVAMANLYSRFHKDSGFIRSDKLQIIELFEKYIEEYDIIVPKVNIKKSWKLQIALFKMNPALCAWVIKRFG